MQCLAPLASTAKWADNRAVQPNGQALPSGLTLFYKMHAVFCLAFAISLLAGLARICCLLNHAPTERTRRHSRSHAGLDHLYPPAYCPQYPLKPTVRLRFGAVRSYLLLL